MPISQTNLRAHFPMIRDIPEIMADIEASPSLSDTFNSWKSDRQELFLDICSGARGIKMLYDSPFKEILNPEHTPERLSSLLSELIGRKVIVIKALPNDSERLGDEMSLIITDIVVELEDGTIANIEVQKIGYLFTGERASCYSADLLLRQYKRVRDEQKEEFSYKNLAPVYTIVFMEKSSKEFHDFPDEYVHYIEHQSNTGIKLNLLQNFIFVTIDIFLDKLHNEGIKSKLDAWLTFLGCDEPEMIVKLITEYPEFEPMYTHLYDLCRNIEGVMKMFSKELQIMDRNTVTYMIDSLQEKLDIANEQLEDKDKTINDKDKTIEDKDKTIHDKDKTIKDKDKTIAEKDAIIKKLQDELNKKK